MRASALFPFGCGKGGYHSTAGNTLGPLFPPSMQMPGPSSIIPQDPNIHNPLTHAQSIGRAKTRVDLQERSLLDPGGIVSLKKAGGKGKGWG